MWHAWALARPPSCSISATTRAQESRLRLVTTTCAPASARRRAMASPMPLLAPVTRATRPSSRNSCTLLALMSVPHEDGRALRQECLHAFGKVIGARRGAVVGQVVPFGRGAGGSSGVGLRMPRRSTGRAARTSPVPLSEAERMYHSMSVPCCKAMITEASSIESTSPP